MYDARPNPNDAPPVLRRLMHSPLSTSTGTAATSQVVGEALGLSLPHAALSPSGQPVWLDMARRSAKALVQMSNRGITTKHVLTDASVRNALAVFAAFGGSTNLLLHTPAV